jgi:hypothetical protein
MTSAIPGGAPGYHDDKDFGNNIAHWIDKLPKGCADHSGQGSNVKAAHVICVFLQLSGLHGEARVGI